MGGQIVDLLLRDLFGYLRTPPCRVTGEDVFMPVSDPLELGALLKDDDIETALLETARAARRR